MLKVLVLLLIDLYQAAFSWKVPVCRYQPTCSHFAQEVIRHHGLAKGSRMALARILSCHPWQSGGQ